MTTPVNVAPASPKNYNRYAVLTALYGWSRASDKILLSDLVASLRLPYHIVFYWVCFFEGCGFITLKRYKYATAENLSWRKQIIIGLSKKATLRNTFNNVENDELRAFLIKSLASEKLPVQKPKLYLKKAA